MSDRDNLQWTTSRPDMDSYTANEDGETEHVVYIYRGDEPRIAVFAGPLDNARERAARIIRAVNSHDALLAACKLAVIAISECVDRPEGFVPDVAAEARDRLMAAIEGAGGAGGPEGEVTS